MLWQNFSTMEKKDLQTLNLKFEVSHFQKFLFRVTLTLANIRMNLHN